MRGLRGGLRPRRTGRRPHSAGPKRPLRAQVERGLRQRAVKDGRHWRHAGREEPGGPVDACQVRPRRLARPAGGEVPLEKGLEGSARHLGLGLGGSGWVGSFEGRPEGASAPCVTPCGCGALGCTVRLRCSYRAAAVLLDVGLREGLEDGRLAHQPLQVVQEVEALLGSWVSFRQQCSKLKQPGLVVRDHACSPCHCSLLAIACRALLARRANPAPFRPSHRARC
jgi:hypothetical protein